MELGKGKVPDYPPKTPPPPKKPVELPHADPKDPRPDPRVAIMRNRRGVNWPFESAPWVAGHASSRVLDQLTA